MIFHTLKPPASSFGVHTMTSQTREIMLTFAKLMLGMQCTLEIVRKSMKRSRSLNMTTHANGTLDVGEDRGWCC